MMNVCIALRMGVHTYIHLHMYAYLNGYFLWIIKIFGDFFSSFVCPFVSANVGGKIFYF